MTARERLAPLAARLRTALADEKQRVNLLVCMGLAGLLLLAVSSWLPADSSTQSAAPAAKTGSTTDYAAELETRLTALISRVEGAGKTAVMVTLESGSESIYATDTDSDGSSTHVLLGSGGASLTAQTAARRGGAAEVVVVSRFGPDNYDNLSRHADAEILVNATPVGMYPGNGQSPVDLSVFPVCQGVLDVIYNPRRTALLLQAEARSIPCSDGLPMLVAQAVAAEERFFNRSIPAGENERILVQLRREMTNLILIGMPGSGKTTVGEALSRLTGREAVDLDQMIETTAGCSIPEIFQREGESGFRARERAAAEEAGKRTGVILLTGGGIIKTAENYAALHQNGRIYQLVRDLSLLPTEGRPLSQGADLAAMWRERAPLYARFRDVEIDNSGTVEDTAAAIWRDFCAHSGS
ncbi:MAG: shikimate kinase [Oscillibacter sp.]|nr:shikimate kinase [Oscillibacter sp.]